MNRIDDQEKYYDSRWEKHTYANRLKLIWCIAILSEVSKTRILNSRVIELGCGTGWLSSILGCFDPTVGIDLSKEAISKATSNYPLVFGYEPDLLSF